tara:strand:- start:175 stop:417 length:243 start_codon:yes stop_codon:yes gene_type:complete
MTTETKRDNIMKDRIIDGMTEQKIEDAVVEFNYKGWLVSFSQVFKVPTVAIFKGDMEIYNITSIETAIDRIDVINHEALK